MTARPSTTLPILAATVLIPVAIALIFWWVPVDADQGISQRIFYFHVPVALTTYACFAFAAVCAALHLTRRDPAWDLRSYRYDATMLASPASLLCSRLRHISRSLGYPRAQPPVPRRPQGRPGAPLVPFPVFLRARILGA